MNLPAPPRIDLSGRVALITGGAGGLGSACARVLGAAGAVIVLADRAGDRLLGVTAELNESGISTYDVAADLTEPQQCTDVVERAVSRAGRLDILVNSVGIAQTKPMSEVGITDWQTVIDVNLTGVFHTTRAAADHLAAHGGGSIVSISSVAGRSGRPNAPAYAASKAGLLSLTKSAALAYGPSVRVNAVCPGIVMTEMWRGIIRDRDHEFGPGAGQQYLDELSARMPLARPGEPQEIAQAVAFLASDLSTYITGQAVNVDGGLEMD